MLQMVFILAFVDLSETFECVPSMAVLLAPFVASFVHLTKLSISVRALAVGETIHPLTDVGVSIWVVVPSSPDRELFDHLPCLQGVFEQRHINLFFTFEPGANSIFTTGPG